jgi:hypothetical protein
MLNLFDRFLSLFTLSTLKRVAVRIMLDSRIQPHIK